MQICKELVLVVASNSQDGHTIQVSMFWLSVNVRHKLVILSIQYWDS